MQGYLIFIIEQLEEENTNPLWRISYSKQISKNSINKIPGNELEVKRKITNMNNKVSLVTLTKMSKNWKFHTMLVGI